MGELGEFWRDVKKNKKEEREKRKASNYLNGIKILEDYKVSYEQQKNRLHLVVEEQIDYWPSTGKYIIRKTKKKGRGIFNLLKELGIER